MAQKRLIRVDDRDQGFHYSAGWSAVDGSTFIDGNFGLTYRSTLHSTKASTASFTYTFNGSNGVVYGTTNVQNSSGVLDPTWSCSVDGKILKPLQVFSFRENNWELCKWNTSEVSEGLHTVTVTVKSSGQVFLFDYFDYVPAQAVEFKGVDIIMPFSDPAIAYGDGWKVLGELGMIASNGGAVTISFYGTALSWYGDTPQELPRGSAPATYSLDGGPNTSWTIPGDTQGSTEFNRFYFKTPTVALGRHTLKVTSNGSSSLTPIVLGSLVIENGATKEPGSGTGSASGSPTSSQTGSVGGSATGTPPGISDKNGRSDIPAIVGGVVGGLVVLGIFIFAFVFYRRRKRRRSTTNTGTLELDKSAVAPPSVTGQLSPRPTLYQSDSIIPSFYGSPGQSSIVPFTIAAAPTSQPYSIGPGAYYQPPDATHISQPSYLNTSPPSSATGGSSINSATPLQPSRGNLPRMAPAAKQREAMQEQQEAYGGIDGHTNAGSVIDHQDSGVRLAPLSVGTHILENPPVYTPS